MNKDLPKGWRRTTLEEVTTKITNGANLQQQDAPFEGSFPISRIETIAEEKVNLERVKYVAADEKELLKYGIQPGDILFSHINSDKHLGKTAYFDLETPVIHGINLLLIRASEKYNSKLLNYYFRHYRYSGRFLEIAQRSVNQSSINQRRLKAISVPLPPLPEQHRIVARLDTLFGHPDRLRERLERIPALLGAFRQAVLTQAVTGKLTEAWREEHQTESVDILFDNILSKRKFEYDRAVREAKASGSRKPRKVLPDTLPEIEELSLDLPDNWRQVNIDFLAHVTKLAGFEYTDHFKVKDQGDIPVVRAQNVQMGGFEEKNLLYIDKATSDYLERSQLFGREILMVFIGAGTGNVCMAPTNRRWHLGPNVAKIDVDGILPEYVYRYLQSPVGLASTLSHSKATAQQSLSMEIIRKIVVTVPPIEEQQEIVRRVDFLFAKADAIEARYEQLKAKLDRLPQAILGKAFRGELVGREVKEIEKNSV